MTSNSCLMLANLKHAQCTLTQLAASHSGISTMYTSELTVNSCTMSQKGRGGGEQKMVLRDCKWGEEHQSSCPVGHSAHASWQWHQGQKSVPSLEVQDIPTSWWEWALQTTCG